LLASENPDEVVYGTAALKRALAKAGIDLRALADQVEHAQPQASRQWIRAEGGWRSDLAMCSRYSSLLAQREREFIKGISFERGPSEWQHDRLRGIAMRLRIRLRGDGQ